MRFKGDIEYHFDIGIVIFNSSYSPIDEWGG